jgi:hypothetical protein
MYLKYKRKTDYCPRGTIIAPLGLFRIHTDKIWCVFSSYEESRRRIGEGLMGGSLPGIRFFLA